MPTSFAVCTHTAVAVPLHSLRSDEEVGEWVGSFAVVYGSRDQTHTHTYMLVSVIDRFEIISDRSATMTTIMYSGDDTGFKWLKIITDEYTSTRDSAFPIVLGRHNNITSCRCEYGLIRDDNRGGYGLLRRCAEEIHR